MNTTPSYVIVGLGNHGEEYRGTRHNVGFTMLDTLVSSVKYQVSENFTFEKIFNAEIAKGTIGNEEVLLVKPHTFMNNSGTSVAKLVRNYELPFGHTQGRRVTSDLIIVHDDITIELGKVKISVGGSSGNHKGVQSIIDHLKTNEFIRVRLGIGRGVGELKDVVLSKFKNDEREIVNKMVVRASEACLAIINDGVEKAMNRFNTSL